MRISDWSSDVCSSDLFDVVGIYDASNGQISAALQAFAERLTPGAVAVFYYAGHSIQFEGRNFILPATTRLEGSHDILHQGIILSAVRSVMEGAEPVLGLMVLDASRQSALRSEEHTSELQSLMRISYAVFCLKHKKEQP